MSKQVSSNQSHSSPLPNWPVAAPAAVGVAIIAQRSLGRDHVGERYEGVRIGGEAVELLLVHPLVEAPLAAQVAEVLDPALEHALEVLETPQGLWLIRTPEMGRPWLASLRERSGQAPEAALSHVKTLATSLSHLHAAGRSHGYLYADTLRVLEGGAWFVRSPWGFDLRAVPKGELKAIRSPMLAPEVAFEGQLPGPVSDIFSLGCILGAEVAGGLTEPGLSLREQGLEVSEAIDALYLKATSAEPDQRHPSLVAFIADLSEILGENTPSVLAVAEAPSEALELSSDATVAEEKAPTEQLSPLQTEALETAAPPLAPETETPSSEPAVSSVTPTEARPAEVLQTAPSEDSQAQPQADHTSGPTWASNLPDARLEDELNEVSVLLDDEHVGSVLELAVADQASFDEALEKSLSSEDLSAISAAGAELALIAEKKGPEQKFSVLVPASVEESVEATTALETDPTSDLDAALEAAFEEAEALEAESTWVEDLHSMRDFQGLELQDVEAEPLFPTLETGKAAAQPAPPHHTAEPVSDLGDTTPEVPVQDASLETSEPFEADIQPESTLLDLPEAPPLDLLSDSAPAFEPERFEQSGLFHLNALKPEKTASRTTSRPATGRVAIPRPAVYTPPPPEDPLASSPMAHVTGVPKSRRLNRPAVEHVGEDVELKEETTLSLSRRQRRPQVNQTMAISADFQVISGLSAQPSGETVDGAAPKAEITEPDLPPIPSEFLQGLPSLPETPKAPVAPPELASSVVPTSGLKVKDEDFEAEIGAESTLVEGIAPALLDIDVLGIELSKVKDRPSEPLVPVFEDSQDPSPFLVKERAAPSTPLPPSPVSHDLPEVPDQATLDLINRPPPSLKSLQSPAVVELTLGGFPVGSANPYAKAPERSKLWLWVGLGVVLLAAIVFFVTRLKAETAEAEGKETQTAQAQESAKAEKASPLEGAGLAGAGLPQEAAAKAEGAAEPKANAAEAAPSEANAVQEENIGTVVVDENDEVLELEPEEVQAPPQASELVLISDPDSLRCPDGMLKLKKKRQVKDAAGQTHDTWDVHCMDRFEFPGGGAMPMTNVDLSAAKAACAARGKRLCTRSEWRRGCGGTYPYGRSYEEGRCATSSMDGTPGSVVAAGSKAGCRSPSGAMDMVGNVAEWTSDGFINGGAAARNADDATCSMSSKRAGGAPHIGFRCCADAK